MTRPTETNPLDERRERHMMQSPTPLLPPMSSIISAHGHITSSQPLPCPTEGEYPRAPIWSSGAPSWHPHHPNRAKPPHQYHLSYITPPSYGQNFPIRKSPTSSSQPSSTWPFENPQRSNNQDDHFAGQRQTTRDTQSWTHLSDDLEHPNRTPGFLPRCGKEQGGSQDGDRNPNPYTSHEPANARIQSQPRPELQNATSMPISGLLSVDPSPATHPPASKYKISLRQQPIAARACGFGDRDRRVIDPPPILQLSIDDETATREEITARLRTLSYSVVHCTLINAESYEDDSLMPEVVDKKQQRRLMGTLVASPFVGLDEFDVEGCFYTFPDLSVRTPGYYRLLFRLVILNPQAMCEGSKTPISTAVMSDAFKVFNAKEFRGMRSSTELTKRLKNQGCLISVKKGNARATGTQARDELNEEGDEDIDGGAMIDDEDAEDSGMSAVKKGKRPSGK